MDIFKQTVKRSTSLLVIAVFVAALGVAAFLGMPRSLFPEINYPRVRVEVNMGFAPLQVMEWSVTSALEKELRAVPGVRLVKSSSSRGQSMIDVFLRESEEVTLAVQRVNAKLAEARALIPPGAEISVRPITAAAFPGAEYCFTSETKNSRELRTFVEYTIKPLVMVIPGIFNARVLGGDLPEFSVELDPRKLALRNLNVSDVNDRLRNSNSVDFLGPINMADQQVLAFGGRFVRTEKEIENVVVDSSLGRAVRIGDLGEVKLQNAWKTKHLSLSGNECVGLDIFYQMRIDQKRASAQVARTIQEVIEKNPGDRYRSWDLNDFTDSATNAVLIDLLAGMLVIGAVTFLFLKDLHYSLIALLSMPLAAAFTFLAMSRLGLSINLMTLGGLTAAIGLVVDNTVIILEMYHHRKVLHPARPRSELLLETLQSVAKPMIFGTVTIALVFTPIGNLSGISGMFFAPMSEVHGSSLMISVVLALLVVPGLILLVDGGGRAGRRGHDEFRETRLARTYRRFLAWALRKPRQLPVFLLLAALLGLGCLPLARTGFLPEWDEGDMVIDFRSVRPMSLESAVKKLRPLEEHLNGLPEVDFFIRKLGTRLSLYNQVPYVGEMILKLKKRRAKSVFQIEDEIRAKTEQLVEGFEFDLFQILPDRLNDLSGSAKPIVLYLHGKDHDSMDRAATAYKNALSAIKGLTSVRIETPEKSPELLFQIDERLSRAVDLNPTSVNENVRFGLFSLDSSSVQNGPQPVPIRLRSKASFNASSLESVPIYTSRGGLTSVERLGQVDRIMSRIESSHIDGSPVRTLTAEISGRDLGSVVKDIQEVMRKLPTDDVFPELAGDFEMQQRSFKELLWAFVIGLALIFMTSLLFSNRLRVAALLSVCSLVPPITGLVGCVIFGIPLDVSSFSGLISVTGISVANSFMALSAIEALPGHRDRFRESVLNGMISRLRPILMTNLAAMAGFLPIAIGLAEGDEILRPFSIAIIIGLLGAIFTTLVLVPLFYNHYAGPRSKPASGQTIADEKAGAAQGLAVQ